MFEHMPVVSMHDEQNKPHQNLCFLFVVHLRENYLVVLQRTTPPF